MGGKKNANSDLESKFSKGLKCLEKKWKQIFTDWQHRELKRRKSMLVEGSNENEAMDWKTAMKEISGWKESDFSRTGEVRGD